MSVGAAPQSARTAGKNKQPQHPDQFLAHHIQQPAQGQQQAGNHHEIGNNNPFHHAAERHLERQADFRERYIDDAGVQGCHEQTDGYDPHNRPFTRRLPAAGQCRGPIASVCPHAFLSRQSHRHTCCNFFLTSSPSFHYSKDIINIDLLNLLGFQKLFFSSLIHCPLPLSNDETATIPFTIAS